MTVSIGFDATPLLLPRTGIGNYSLELLRAMQRLADPPTITLLSNRPLANEFHTLGKLNTTAFPSRWLWMHSRLPQHLTKQSVQLAHFPNNSAPLWSSTPYILTIHDASLFLYPEHHPWQRLLTVRTFLPQAARRAAAIITVSQHAKRELQEILQLPDEKLHVVYEAASERFRKRVTSAEIDTIQHKYNLPADYLLFVGTLEPRKNLPRLLTAYAAMLQADPTKKQYKLVLAGSDGWGKETLSEQITALGLQQQVIFLGYVNDNDLPGLYAGATLFIFPSLHEGFGLPPLEAMACGTPVLTSSNSAMSEICGDAAAYVDPRDEDAMTRTLCELLDNRHQLIRLGRCGLQRAANFSWDRAAQETMAVYRSVLNQLG